MTCPWSAAGDPCPSCKGGAGSSRCTTEPQRPQPSPCSLSPQGHMAFHVWSRQPHSRALGVPDCLSVQPGSRGARAPCGGSRRGSGSLTQPWQVVGMAFSLAFFFFFFHLLLFLRIVAAAKPNTEYCLTECALLGVTGNNSYIPHA